MSEQKSDRVESRVLRAGESIQIGYTFGALVNYTVVEGAVAVTITTAADGTRNIHFDKPELLPLPSRLQ